jgi:hypothetical protein
MKSQDAAEVHFGFSIALQPAKDGTPEHEELGLVGRTPETLRQNVDCLIRLLQSIEQAGEVESALNVTRFHLQ